MAKQLSKIGVLDGRLATAAQVTQSIDAFTGIDAYDITISGSLTVTGSTNISGTLGITGFPDVSASLAAADDGFPYSGSALISGSLIVTGSTNIDGLVTATSFSGDGSNITGVTGEWDGTHDGNAEITGSLILTQNLTASNISASGDVFGVTGSFSHVVGNSPITVGDPITFLQAITASNNISASGFIKANNGVFNAGGISIDGKPIDYVAPNIRVKNTGLLVNAGSLTASNDISASGDFKAGKLFIDDKGAIDTYVGTGNELTLNPDGTWDAIRLNRDGAGKPILLEGDVTSSGNISASNTVFGITGSFSHVVGNSPITVGNSITFLQPITASGNISSSGNITASKFNANSTAAGGAYLISGKNALARNTTLDRLNVNVDGAFAGGVSIGFQPEEEIAQQLRLVGNLTASGGSFKFSGITPTTATEVSIIGDISASKEIVANSFRVENRASGVNCDLIITGSTFNGDSRDAQIIYPSHGLHFNSDASNNHTLALAGPNVGIRKEPDDGNALQVSGSISIEDGNILGVTNITASGNISSSKFIGGGLEIEGASSIKIDSETSGMEIFGNQIEMGGRDESKLLIINGLNGSGTGRLLIGDSESDFNGAHLDIQVGGAAAHFNGLNVTGSGHALFQAGKPIITHTTHLSASITQAGFYNIVGGQFTCSITTSNAPIGAEYEFFQTSSAGNFLFHSGSGITLISKNDSYRLAQQGSSAVLKKVGTSTFHLMGDLT